QVHLRVASGPSQGQVMHSTTDERGEFRFAHAQELEGVQALIEVDAPAAEGPTRGQRLAASGPRSVRLPAGPFMALNTRTNVHESRLDEIALGAARTLAGQVHGTDARP